MFNNKLISDSLRSVNYQYIHPLDRRGIDPSYKYPVVKRGSLESELIRDIRMLDKQYVEIVATIMNTAVVPFRETVSIIVMTYIQYNDMERFNKYLSSMGCENNRYMNTRFQRSTKCAKKIMDIAGSGCKLIIPDFTHKGLKWLSFLLGKNRIVIDDLILVKDSAQPRGILLRNGRLQEYLEAEHDITLAHDESVLAVNITILPQ